MRLLESTAMGALVALGITLSGRLFKVILTGVVCLVLSPVTAWAQSTIVGTVRDKSGAVIPGVTVEAASPALIEKVRSATTDGLGQYRVVDLRPGTYTITFKLEGFATLAREGMVLPSDFTATVNAEMEVSTLEETLTVSGEAPIVDATATTRRQTVSQELLDALPTARNFLMIGQTVPAVNFGQTDVGGSTSLTNQGSLHAYGGTGDDGGLQLDGIDMMSASGGKPFLYHNQGEYQEVVVQVVGGSADSQVPGVKVNMIPKEGGNRVTGGTTLTYATSAWQANNLTSELIARRFKSASHLDKTWDVNPDLGGPIVKDRLWFFASYRNWSYNNTVGNVFYKDGSPGRWDNQMQADSGRVTMRLSSRDKVNVSFTNYPRVLYHNGIETGTVAPEATVIQTNDLPAFISQVKWTATLSPRLLLELGTLWHYDAQHYDPQPEARVGTCFTAFDACPPGTGYGDIAHLDLITNILSVGPRGNAIQSRSPISNSKKVAGALSYVTGSHAVKVGAQGSWGSGRTNTLSYNGAITQNYRNGAPESVDVYNVPTASENVIDGNWGFYAMDQWKLKRLTVSPGLRVEVLRTSTAAVDLPAGRWVPARHFDAVTMPPWNDLAPRFAAAYDLFGDGKTVMKMAVGKYVYPQTTDVPSPYNPAVSSSDRRTWKDLNGDDIAQENELGPSTNTSFGIRRNQNPDPDFKRPYEVLWNASVQHELIRGLAISAEYNRRSKKRFIYTKNLVAPDFQNNYTTVTIPDPRGNGETVTVYNLKPELVGFVNLLDTNSSNNLRVFNAIDFNLNLRLPNGATAIAGTSTGKLHYEVCDVTDPNSQRGCVASFPWRTQFKLTGLYPLPYGLQVSGTFQTLPGIVESRFGLTDGDVATNYLVNRTIVPTLTTPQVTVRLDTPGTQFLDRINQLDISVSRSFKTRTMRVTPQVNVFNALNVSAVTDQNQTFGNNLGVPLQVIQGRLLRLGARIDF